LAEPKRKLKISPSSSYTAPSDVLDITRRGLPAQAIPGEKARKKRGFDRSCFTNSGFSTSFNIPEGMAAAVVSLLDASRSMVIIASRSFKATGLPRSSDTFAKILSKSLPGQPFR
tara:strand:- start:7 stop:351 length:345 start_codon:yes stop_codon:yes gene_type:complete